MDTGVHPDLAAVPSSEPVPGLASSERPMSSSPEALMLSSTQETSVTEPPMTQDVGSLMVMQSTLDEFGPAIQYDQGLEFQPEPPALPKPCLADVGPDGGFSETPADASTSQQMDIHLNNQELREQPSVISIDDDYVQSDVNRPLPHTSASDAQQSNDTASAVRLSSKARGKRRRVEEVIDVDMEADVPSSSSSSRRKGPPRDHSHPPITFFGTSPPSAASTTIPTGSSTPLDPALLQSPLAKTTSIDDIREVLGKRKMDQRNSTAANPSSSQPYAEAPSSPRILSNKDSPIVILSSPIASTSSPNKTKTRSSLTPVPPKKEAAKPKPKPNEATAEPLSAYTCPICFSPPTNATLTPCGHVCCGACLFTAVKATLHRGGMMGMGHGQEDNYPRCPVCRAQIPGWDGRGGGVIGLKPRTVFAL